MSDEIIIPIEEQKPADESPAVVNNPSETITTTDIPDLIPSSEPEAPVIAEQPEPVVAPAEKTPLIPLSGEAEPAQAPTIIPTTTPTPIVITPAPELSHVISDPVVSSPPTPLSTLDRISLAFKNNMMNARELLVKAHAVVSARRRKKIDSIMNLFLTKKKIKNSDVRDLFHITDETATVYLNILKKEDKIQQNGKGGGIYYTKV